MSFSEPDNSHSLVMSKRKKRKLAQVQAKKNANGRRENILKQLKLYSLSKDIADQLQSTSSHCRRKPAKKHAETKPFNKSNESFSDTDTESGSSVDMTITVNSQIIENTNFQVNQEGCALNETSPSNIVSHRRNDMFLRRPVVVNRDLTIDKMRCVLPAVAFEQEIIEAVIDHDIVIVTGSTGCGKSTQVPQFLYEAGFSGSTSKMLIGITQPRRVAATSLAERVGIELNNSELCGYQIRHLLNVSHQCCLKFMTDGVLLREIQNDFLCSRYSVLIIDEAHERSLNCDMLIGLLSRTVALRRKRFNEEVGELGPLRLVIMSATLSLSDFVENRNLFPIPPPVITIPSQAHPVTNHFSRVTPSNYISAVAQKIVEIHQKLPPGSILAFLPGRRQVYAVISSIMQMIASQRNTLDEKKENLDEALDNIEHFTDEDDLSHDESVEDVESFWQGKNVFKETPLKVTICQTTTEECTESVNSLYSGGSHFELENEETVEDKHAEQKSSYIDSQNEQQDTAINNVSGVHMEDINVATALGFDSGIGMGSINPKTSDVECTQWLGYGGRNNQITQCKIRVVPLYALLPVEEQKKAFAPPEDNERVIIVATNIAETSLTFPNIRYVVDSGKQKKMNSSGSDAAYLFSVRWISKSSADQRAGRAGRIGPGHCYRLYSSAVYTNIFREAHTPDLLTLPLASTLLFMASLGIPDVDQFPFPTPPSPLGVRQAKELLVQLKALETVKIPKKKNQTCITPLGRLMARLPLSPRLSSCLISALSMARMSSSIDILPLCCLVCAAWTVARLPALASFNQADKGVPVGWRNCKSDAEVACWLLSHYLKASNKKSFIEKNGVNEKQLVEASQLYQQLLLEVRRIMDFGMPVDHWLENPPYPCSSKMMALLHDILLIGFVDHVCIFHELLPVAQQKNCANGYIWGGSVFFSYDTTESNPLGLHNVTIPKTSVLRDLRPRPSFMAFSHAIATESDSIAQEKNKTKLVLHHCFPVNPHFLATINSSLLLHSDIVSFPPPTYNLKEDRVIVFRKATFLPLSYELPAAKVSSPNNNEITYRVFCQAFLEGKVVPCLKEVHNKQQSFLRIPPAWVICLRKKNSSDQKRAQFTRDILPPLQSELQNFVQALQNKECYSCKRLKKIWQQESTYLKKEYKALLLVTCPRSLFAKIMNSWGNSLFNL